jgi:hypothetical protein
MPDALPPNDSFYQWKEYRRVHEPDGSLSAPRLLTPWSDPNEYEWPMDWMFETPEKAKETKLDLAPCEEWVLVKVTYEVVEVVGSVEDEDED